MKNKLLLLILLSSLISVSCHYDFAFWPRKDNVNERSASFTALEDVDCSTTARFAVLVLGDTHFGRNGWVYFKRYEGDFYNKFKQVAQDYKNKGMDIIFALNTGDCSDSGKVSEFIEYNAFENQIKKIVKDTGGNENIKIYNIAGNHDLFNNGWSNWKKYCYPNTSTYYFKTNSVNSSLSWYFLDSASGTLGNTQYNLFNKLLEQDSNQKIILSHYPIAAKNCDLYTMQDPIEIAKMIKTYSNNNVKLGIEGHFHAGARNDFYKNDGSFLFHEEVIAGYTDYKEFTILTVDLSGTTPVLSIQKFKY